MNKITAAVLWGLVAFVLLKLVFSFVSLPVLWGFNQFYYLPRGFSFAAAIVALLAIVWGLIKKPEPKQAASRKKKNAPKKSAPDKTILAFLVIVSGILFTTIQVAWPFLGDGSAFLGAIFQFHTHGKMVFTPLETPPMLVIYGVYYLSELTGKTMSAFFPFSVVGAISGVAFVYFAFRLSRLISSEFWTQWLTLGLLVAAGGSLFFFGYVETYHLQYACILLYCYEALRYIEQKTTLLRPFIALALAIIFHLVNFLLVPSFVLLYSLRGETDRRSADKRKLVLRWFYIIAPLLVIIYAYFQWHPIIEPPSEPQNPFIPFFAFKGFSYTLLSGQRILDIINENLLLAGVAFFIIAAILLSARKKISFSDPYLLCLIVNFLFYEAFLIGGNAGFGLARDWDVFSAIGIFAALISVALLRQIQFPSIKRLALPIILVSLLSISSWVYLNVRVRSAAARYEDIVEIYTPKIETKWAMMGYENLRKFHASRDITDELRVIRKMVERSPRHTTVQTAETDAMLHIEDINARGKEEFRMLVDHLKDLSDSLLREEVFAKVRIGPHGSGESITLGEQFEDGIMILYRKFGVFSLSEAIRNVDDLIAHHPSLPYGYELRGFLMYLFANDAKGAIPAIEKAIAIDTTRARPHLYLALALAKTGDRSRANAEFRSALALDPGWLGGLTYYSSFIADPQNDSVRADDISFASGLLKKVIDAPPESTLEAHVQTQNARAALAQRLLHEVEIRPVRHQ